MSAEHVQVRVRLEIIGTLETMHDSDLATFVIISLPTIFKRTRRVPRLGIMRVFYR